MIDKLGQPKYEFKLSQSYLIDRDKSGRDLHIFFYRPIKGTTSNCSKALTNFSR